MMKVKRRRPRDSKTEGDHREDEDHGGDGCLRV